MKRVNSERPPTPSTSDRRPEAGQEDNSDAQGDAPRADAGATLHPAQPAANGDLAEGALPLMVFPGPYAYLQAPVMLPGENVPLVSQAQVSFDAMNLSVNQFTRMPDEPAFVHAARVGHPGLVRQWLDAGIDVNLSRQSTGDTALMAAVGNGHLAIVQQLLAHPGIDPDRHDADGRTALMLAASNKQHAIVDSLLTANASTTRLDRSGTSALQYAFNANSAAVVEIFFRHGKQHDVDVDYSQQHPPSFIAAVGDLWPDIQMSAPALPGMDQPKVFFNELIDRLTGHEKMGRRMLAWLSENGIRFAYALQVVDMLCVPQASCHRHAASRQQKMTYCLSALSRLPALEGTKKVFGLYQDAGISAAAIERLGGVASDQLNGVAESAAAMLAAIGTEMVGTLIDDCLASIGLNSEFDSAKLQAGLLDKGYCAPVAQAIVMSWQGTISTLREKPMSLPASATFNQVAAMLQDYAARHAPALFAQELTRHLASHAVLHQLSAMQDHGGDEGLHAQFQIQCDQLRQFCEQLLEAGTSSTAGTAHAVSS